MVDIATSQNKCSTQFATYETVKFIFAKFLLRFGSRWSSQYPAEIMPVLLEEWLMELNDVTLDEIAVGLRQSRGEYPPTVIEFKNLCKPKTAAPYHQTYTAALPAPSNPDVAKNALENIKTKLNMNKNSNTTGNENDRHESERNHETNRSGN